MQLLNNFVPEQIFTHFTSREQDFTLPKDQDALTVPQTEYLRQVLTVPPEKIYYGRQVHGNTIVAVGEKDVPVKSAIAQADGFVTNVPGIALAVRTADCLPVFLFYPKHRAIGMIHAGWKGTQQQIAVAALDAMRREYGSQPQDVLAMFGPCIRRCCYEVGEDFGNTFPDETFVRFGKYFFDLPLANRTQMLEAGMVPEHIQDDEICTDCEDELFSYRREGEQAGRHLSIIQIKIPT